jgi:hypothetical protein
MIKYGIVDKDSHSDFDLTKKAKYYDELGTEIADEQNKDKLKEPKLIEIEPTKQKSS